MNKTKVKYVKDRVELTMSLDAYSRMCKHFNVLHDAMNDYGETLDFKLTQISGMDDLRYALLHNMGFKRRHDGFYSDYRIPRKGED
tara:strand:+ start:231 stop:488 length:258 start_codon:yes stop_codon:yes gene_type:complete